MKKDDNVVILWHHYEKSIFSKNEKNNRIFGVFGHIILRPKQNESQTAAETNAQWYISFEWLTINNINIRDCIKAIDTAVR